MNMKAAERAQKFAAGLIGYASQRRRTNMDYKKLAETLKMWEEHASFGMCRDWSLFCIDICDQSDGCIIVQAAAAITSLLARAESAEEQCKELEERCKRLNEARERANEAAHKWETMYRGKKEELEMSQNEVSTMSMAGLKMLDAFSEYVRNGSKNPAAYCYYGAAGCGGDGDGCKGIENCNFLPRSGMKEKEK